jgi:hypothetical protein
LVTRVRARGAREKSLVGGDEDGDERVEREEAEECER